MDPTDRQLAIIEAALAVIEAQGVQGFTMKNVAARLGLSDAALYKHFKDKDAILLGIARKFQRASREILEELAADDQLAPLEKIHRFFMGRVRQFAQDRGLTAILFSEELFKGAAESDNFWD